MPLSPAGRFFMGILYFSIPVVSGYYIMEYVKQISEKNLAELKKTAEILPETRMQNQALQGMVKEWKEKR